ncbi:MAG: hypothetical protein V8S58_02195 [Lachnospiraceae bacterium]
MIKNTARMVLVKAGNHAFISTVLADFISRSGANAVVKPVITAFRGA